MTSAEWIDELIAQVEDHGAEAVEIQYVHDTGATRKVVDVEITNVQYEDDKVKVTVES